MKKLFKFLAVIFSFVMLIACAGCNFNFTSTESTGGTSTSTGNGDSSTPEPEPEPEPEKVDPMDTWTKMPRIDIDTPDSSNAWATTYRRADKLADRIDYVDATVSVSECPEDYILEDKEAEVKVRGNYTLDYDKKPIRIKYKKKQVMLGLHEQEKFKNWVLLADWKDKSLLNNNVSFYLASRIMGEDGYYTADCQPVEVYLNNQYWGVYLLTEQQEVKEGEESSRMSVPEVPTYEDENENKFGYAGYDVGYCIEYDGYYDTEMNMPNGAGDPTFTINSVSGFSMYNKGYTVKSDIYYDDGTEWSGDYTKPSTQLSFIQSYVNNAYQIVTSAVKGTYKEFSGDYKSIQNSTKYTTAEATVGAVIDLRSLVDTYIYHEIVCDMDLRWSSFYMCVDMSATGSKKLIFEAPWDKDSALGTCCRLGEDDPSQGLWAVNQGNPWMNFFRGQEWFTDLVVARWKELKEDNLYEDTVAHLNRELDLYGDDLDGDYYKKNFTNKWGSRVTGGHGEVVATIESFKDVNTAQRLTAEYLRDNWLAKRFASLNQVWLQEDVSEDVVVDENIPQGSQAYRYEAENASWTGNASVRDTTDKSYHASGEAYLGDLGGDSVMFTVNAPSATTAYLFLVVSKKDSAVDFNNLFGLAVNNVSVSVPTRYVEAVMPSEEAWHTFTSVKLVPISLNAGANTIKFTAVAAENRANIDAIDVYSTVALS